MKKSLMLFGILGACVLTAGEDLPLNWKPERAAAGAVILPGWSKNYAQHPKVGSGVVVRDDATGKMVFKITAGELLTPYYTAVPVPAKNGQELELKVEARGEGLLQVGYYAYSDKNVWYAVPRGIARVKLTDRKQEFKVKLPLLDGTGRPLRAIRVFIAAEKNSTAWIEDFEAEIESPGK